MATFFGALFWITGGLLAVSGPLFFVAWRRGRPGLGVKFLVAAVAIGLFFAVSAAGSKRMVDNCRDVGGTSCMDVGYKGFLFLVALVYVIVSATATYRLARH